MHKLHTTRLWEGITYISSEMANTCTKIAHLWYNFKELLSMCN